MARAETKTLLPLDTWAKIVGINPMHFCQVTHVAMPHNVCSSVFFQEEWQHSDAVSRESIAHAIEQAERMLMSELGFSLLPTWEVDERVTTTPLAYVGLYNSLLRDANWMIPSVTTDKGYFIAGGIEAKTLIDDAAVIVYSDANSDGYDETATITVNTTVTEPSEIAVYYPGESGNEEWQIKPLRSVSISGGVATIVVDRHQLVKPELLEAFSPVAVDGEVNANFLTTVDVYRHWTNPEQQVQLMWSNDLGLCSCSGDDCVDCTQSTQWGCLTTKNYKLGIVSYHPATWDTDHFHNAEYALTRNPDRLRLWYYAGYQDHRMRYPTLEMDRDFARAVTYLSLTFLERGICGCQNLEAITRYWREDLSLNLSTTSGGTNYQTTQRKLDNPFGTMRGAVFAWDRMKRGNKQLGHAVRL